MIVFSLFFLFFFSKRHGTNFYNVLAFYGSGTLVCVCRHLCFQYCGSQCLFAARQELLNHLALNKFLGVLQFVHMCHSPKAPDFLISSGVVAFCHI